MTNAARADLAFGSVACVTGCMCFDPNWQTLAGSRGFVTRRAALRRKALSRDMCCMDKLHVETLFEFRGKFAQGRRRIFHVVMADRAHRLLFGIRELAYVAADA